MTFLEGIQNPSMSMTFNKMSNSEGNSVTSIPMDNLQRFLDGQRFGYETAFKEMKAGEKRNHWIWYIFPQIAGLGFSSTARFYAISSMQEARDYYANPVLGKRLVEISEALLALDTNDATAVMGYPDDLKLRSSMTLFLAASGDAVFQKVLDKFYSGKPDSKTLSILGL